jgi:hypothetical protein
MRSGVEIERLRIEMVGACHYDRRKYGVQDQREESKSGIEERDTQKGKVDLTEARRGRRVRMTQKQTQMNQTQDTRKTIAPKNIELRRHICREKSWVRTENARIGRATKNERRLTMADA